MKSTSELIVILNDLGISIPTDGSNSDDNAQACFDAVFYLDRIERLRGFLAESPLPVVDAQAVSNIIDGTPESASHQRSQCEECGKVWKDYELDNLPDEPDGEEYDNATGICPQCGGVCEVVQ